MILTQIFLENRFYDLKANINGFNSSTKFIITSVKNSTKFECSLTEHTCLGFDLKAKKKCNSKKAVGFEYCDKHLKEFCQLEIRNSKVIECFK